MRANNHCLRRALRGSPLPLLLIFICCLFNNAALAQSPDHREAVDGVGEVVPLMVGQKVPEEFWSSNHSFYHHGDTIRRNLEEYRGKLLILDFWEPYCGACIKGFPTMDSLQRHLQRQGSTFLILQDFGRGNSTKEQVDNIISHQRSQNNLQLTMPQMVLDKTLRAYFPMRSIPHYVLIGPSGRVLVVGGVQQLAAIIEIINQYTRVI